MLNYDLSPFYRSTVGFDRLLSILDKVAGGEPNAPTYPPYNIERTSENAYRITLAVAGFGVVRLFLPAMVGDVPAARREPAAGGRIGQVRRQAGNRVQPFLGFRRLVRQ